MPESKFMFKNIERKQKFIDDKQHAIEMLDRIKKKQNNGHFSDLLDDSTEQMFSSNFMDSIVRQDEELTKEKKKREINQKFVKVIEEYAKDASVLDSGSQNDITAEISMSMMDDRENSDLLCIKSEYTSEGDLSNMSNKEDTAPPNSDTKPKPEKRKVNVFEYNNLANNNKKMRLVNMSKPLQRTDIIHLENSLDFDKCSPNQKLNNDKNTAMMSQKFMKNNSKFPQPQLSKKISLKSLKMSENDDRKTFISSTDRQMDTTSNKSKRHINKQNYKVKKSKQLRNLTNSVINQSNTPQK